jgi:Kyanoviridae endonuclease
MYQYRAKVVRVVDGDTLHLDVELGFDVTRRDSFRLYGINAPERGTPEGTQATQWLVEHLKGHETIVVTTHKDDREKYGRYLATLWIGGNNLNEAMVAEGHAVPYSGGKR